MVAIRSVPTVLTTSALGWEDSSNQIFGLLVVGFTSVSCICDLRCWARDPCFAPGSGTNVVSSLAWGEEQEQQG